MIKRIKYNILNLSILFLTFTIKLKDVIGGGPVPGVPGNSVGCTLVFGVESENYLKIILSLIQWGIPVAVIIFSILDVLKAVTNGDGKTVSLTWKNFGYRLIIIIIAFMSQNILKLIFNLFGYNFCIFGG